MSELKLAKRVLRNRQIRRENYSRSPSRVQQIKIVFSILCLRNLYFCSFFQKWPLGWIFCNIFISFDVMLCTVSILNLFVISLERYYAVTSPMNYVKILTFRRVCWIIAGIWLFSFVMAFLPIMVGFNTPSQKIQNMYNPSECIFEANKVYVLLVAIFTYFTPLLIMCAVYVRIFLIARRQIERINTLVKSTIRMFDKSKAEKDPRFASDSKATVTLASVVTAFAICWIPYFVIFTARPFLPGPVDTHLDLFALWLGYVNSMLNPFLYAFHSTQFRRAFGGILLRRYDYNRTRTPYGQNV